MLIKTNRVALLIFEFAFIRHSRPVNRDKLVSLIQCAHQIGSYCLFQFGWLARPNFSISRRRALVLSPSLRDTDRPFYVLQFSWWKRPLSQGLSLCHNPKI